MKMEQLIAQYLYLNKKVSLQEIGILYLSADVHFSSESDSSAVLPEHAIRFEFDTKTAMDEGLVQYIVAQTRKIKPLATSDLESYTMLSKQFLHIGKPLIIKNVGTILKNQQNEYVFTQGTSMLSKVEDAETSIAEKDTSKDNLNFKTPKRKSSNKKWILPVLFLLVIAGILTLVFIRFNNEKTISENRVAIQDSPATYMADTSMHQQTVASPAAIDTTLTKSKDSIHYNIIIRTYPTSSLALSAQKKFASFGFSNLILVSKDSNQHVLAVPIYSAFRDSTKIKDSIIKQFGKSAYIELN